MTLVLYFKGLFGTTNVVNLSVHRTVRSETVRTRGGRKTKPNCSINPVLCSHSCTLTLYGVRSTVRSRLFDHVPSHSNTCIFPVYGVVLHRRWRGFNLLIKRKVIQECLYNILLLGTRCDSGFQVPKFTHCSLISTNKDSTNCPSQKKSWHEYVLNSLW